MASPDGYENVYNHKFLPPWISRWSSDINICKNKITIFSRYLSAILKNKMQRWRSRRNSRWRFRVILTRVCHFNTGVKNQSHCRQTGLSSSSSILSNRGHTLPYCRTDVYRHSDCEKSCRSALCLLDAFKPGLASRDWLRTAFFILFLIFNLLFTPHDVLVLCSPQCDNASEKVMHYRSLCANWKRKKQITIIIIIHVYVFYVSTRAAPVAEWLLMLIFSAFNRSSPCHHTTQAKFCCRWSSGFSRWFFVPLYEWLGSEWKK